MAKIAILANNYGQPYDGVGAYASAVASAFSNMNEVVVFTEKCLGTDSAFKKLFNFGMVVQFEKLMDAMQNGQFDTVLLEYPFVEWNPLVMLQMYRLKRLATYKNIKIVVSLHEYQRVNFIRKIVIRSLVRHADKLLVSTDEMKKELIKYCGDCVLRPIPSNIAVVWEPCAFKKDEFVFFGLVNGAKAFEEMLAGWDLFNENNQNILHVISGTELSGIEDKHRGIQYHYQATEADITAIMSRCVASIVPVRPCVDMKNTTFKTSCLTRCISIGRFCEEYKDLPFVHDMKAYTAEDFVAAFSDVSAFSEQYIEEISVQAENFAKMYSVESVAELVLSNIM